VIEKLHVGSRVVKFAFQTTHYALDSASIAYEKEKWEDMKWFLNESSSYQPANSITSSKMSINSSKGLNNYFLVPHVMF